jgi:predicted Rossmann fold nucleotide-binding protein DprA/Smf involved in DNA uptake
MSVLYSVGAPLGAVLGRRPAAVAGTRNPTHVGRRLACEVGRRLAEGGCSAVTGFARGVEAALCALGAGGRAVAVLPHLLEVGSARAQRRSCAPPRGAAHRRLQLRRTW